MCFIMFEVYLNMLSGKIITPKAIFLAQNDFPGAFVNHPELGPASKPSDWHSSSARV